jgi:hypothetical protein
VISACSSGAGSNGGANQGTGGEDGGTGGQQSDGPAVEAAGQPQDAATEAAHDASGAHDAHASDASDGGGAGDAGGASAAGKAGADAFCAQLCSLDERCAALGDASVDMASCVSSCQSANEAPMANPPTELLRADYVSGLGSCIAGASCTGPLTSTSLQTIEANCASMVVAGLQPTQTVSIFCRDLETSPCNSPDAGTQDCVSRIMFYSDTALNAAIACFSMTPCTQVGSCYNMALYTQP